MRLTIMTAAIISAATASPATAQMFWQSPDFSGAPLVAGEPGIGVALPGATLAEERAAWAWQLRAGLNVAALQCNFDKTLLVRDNYNGVLTNHAGELNAAYDAIRKYFQRMNKVPRAAQGALDTWGTKTYSGFATVRSQYGFCETAARVAKRAAFAARGSFTLFAVERLRELRNSLAPGGEQYFRFPMARVQIAFPLYDKKCWDKRDNYKTTCGYSYS